MTALKIGIMVAAAIPYIYGIVKMCKELKIYKTAEERRYRQIYPMMLTSTALYAAIVYQVIRFWNYF